MIPQPFNASARTKVPMHNPYHRFSSPSKSPLRIPLRPEPNPSCSPAKFMLNIHQHRRSRANFLKPSSTTCTPPLAAPHHPTMHPTLHDPQHILTTYPTLLSHPEPLHLISIMMYTPTFPPSSIATLLSTRHPHPFANITPKDVLRLEEFLLANEDSSVIPQNPAARWGAVFCGEAIPGRDLMEEVRLRDEMMELFRRDLRIIRKYGGECAIRVTRDGLLKPDAWRRDKKWAYRRHWWW